MGGTKMKDELLEGTLVLEKLNEMNLLDDFYEAVDEDNLEKVQLILKRARIDSVTIAMILRKIEDGED